MPMKKTRAHKFDKFFGCYCCFVSNIMYKDKVQSVSVHLRKKISEKEY